MNFKLKFLSFLTIIATLCFSYDKDETPEGWASQGGGTTGGSGGEEVTVSTISDLRQALFFGEKKIVLVKKGTYEGSIEVNSNKSILGIEPGVLIKGNIAIHGKNIIIRNIAIQDEKCKIIADTMEECGERTDAISIHRTGSQNIWLDHLDISDGRGGNCNITMGANNITITWTKFHYTYAKLKASSNTIGGNINKPDNEGRLQVTYAYCWWADNVIDRMPRGNFGKVHILNNLYTSNRTKSILGPGFKMQMLIENNAFLTTGETIKDCSDDGSASWKSTGNIGTSDEFNTSQGTVFTPPYTIKKIDASEVEAKVKAGAGNNMTLNITASKGKPVRNNRVVQPRIHATKSGWILQNPGSSTLSFIVVTLKGQTVLPVTMLKAGKSYLMPSVASTLLIKFKGVNAPSGIYVPLAH